MTCKKAAGRISAFMLALSVFLTVTAGAAELIGTLPLILYGEGSPDAELGQTNLGGAAADGAVLTTGADVAILPAADLGANLLAGEVSAEALAAAMPRDEELSLVVISPAELYEMLEHGLSHFRLDSATKEVEAEDSRFDGFPQVSGFRYRGDLTMPPGQRVMEVVLDGGETLDRTDEAPSMTLVSTSSLLAGGYGYPVREAALPADVTDRDALAQLIAAGTLTARYDATKRAELVGSDGSSLAEKYHLGLLAAIGIALILATTGWRRKED